MVLPGGNLQKGGVRVKPLLDIGEIEVDFSGALIGTNIAVFNRYGIAKWSDISMKVFCDNNSYNYTIPSVGETLNWYDRIMQSPDVLVINMLLAPITFRFSPKCQQNIEKVSLSFNHFHSRINPRRAEKINIQWQINQGPLEAKNFRENKFSL